MEIGETALLGVATPTNVSVSVSFLRDPSDVQELWDLLMEGRPPASVARFDVSVQPAAPAVHVAEVEGPNGDIVRAALPCTGGGSDPVAATWDGRGDDGSPVPVGKYKIRLRAACGGVQGSAESEPIKIVRVGVVAAAFSGKMVYPLRFAFREFPKKFDNDSFDVPAWQWQLASLDDAGKARAPPPAATGRSADANTYCYPFAAKRSSKLKPRLKAAGAGYGSSDGISLKLLRADGSAFSDQAAASIALDKTYKLEANEASKLPPSVQKTQLELAFAFEYTNSKGQVTKLGLQRCSKMTVYVLVSEPQDPWGRGSVANRQRPWVELLEKACTQWATGATTVEMAASLVVTSVNSRRKMNLTYDTVEGKDLFKLTSKVGTKPDAIQLRKFLKWLAGDPTRPKKWNVVNCTVCGALVSTISNALGCSLHSSWMGMSFGCHKIIAIGDWVWHHPFHQYYGAGDTYGEFSYHEVAWTGAAGAGDAIYDACLKVASDPVGSPAMSPLLAKGMTFATSSPAIDDYLRRLVLPSHVAATAPIQAFAGRYKAR